MSLSSTRFLPDDSQSVSSSSTVTCASDASSNNNSINTRKTNAHAPDDKNKKYARMARSSELAARTLQSQLIKADERAQALQRQLTACEQRVKVTEEKLRLCQRQLKDAHNKNNKKSRAAKPEQAIVEKEKEKEMEVYKTKCRMALVRVFALVMMNNRRNQARIERHLNELKFRTVVGEDNKSRRESEGESGVGLQVALNASVHCHQPFNGLTLVRSADACERRPMASNSLNSKG